MAALVAVCALGCRIEPIERGGGDERPEGPAWRWSRPASGAGASTLERGPMVLGLLPDGETLERSARLLCGALERGVDPDTAVHDALRELECARRAHGEAFSQALLIGARGRWGAAADVTSAYLGTDAAASAYRDGRGLDQGALPPLPLAHCGLVDETLDDPSRTRWPNPEEVAENAALDGAFAPWAGRPLQAGEGLEPDEGPTGLEDAGLPMAALHDAGPGDPFADAAATLESTVEQTPPPEPVARPPPPRTDDAVAYALVLRTAARTFHAGWLGGRTAPGSHRLALPAGLDALPGQLLEVGPRGAVLVRTSGPRDPRRAPAPAAQLYARAFQPAPTREAEQRAHAAPAQDALSWLLPRRGAPVPVPALTPPDFAALPCPVPTEAAP